MNEHNKPVVSRKNAKVGSFTFAATCDTYMCSGIAPNITNFSSCVLKCMIRHGANGIAYLLVTCNKWQMNGKIVLMKRDQKFQENGD